ncbi:hypothetical protein ASG31_09155 [Chryseobacterium sp. Leaf404]|uniref:hypothetical protein n=1 Tax=unclassified Chryseobacterium TaxID=2593645 RepID=UPI00070082B9|nr:MULTISPECIES: hypothetical protein [unclassified Chryseobacterium]KQT17558.1 hypothetical protein ASG31_09155 [Chryseobacterium sp. Leaf404]
MKEENINKLNSLFSNLKSEEQKLKESMEKKKSEDDLFIEGFRTLCKNFIDPKMQEFRRMLRENGFGCKISFNEEIKNGLGINSQTNIKLQISRNVDSNFYVNDKFPHIMFVADKNLKRIVIHQDTIFQNGTGNAALKEKNYTLDNLSEEDIEREILESVENILVNK